MDLGQVVRFLRSALLSTHVDSSDFEVFATSIVPEACRQLPREERERLVVLAAEAIKARDEITRILERLEAVLEGKREGMGVEEAWRVLRERLREWGFRESLERLEECVKRGEEGEG